MAEPIFQVTRISQAPAELRLVVTATGQTLTLAPGESTVTGSEVAALLEADASLREHFTCKPFSSAAAHVPVTITAKAQTSDNE